MKTIARDQDQEEYEQHSTILRNSRTLLNQENYWPASSQFGPLGVSACRAANFPTVVPVLPSGLSPGNYNKEDNDDNVTISVTPNLHQLVIGLYELSLSLAQFYPGLILLLYCHISLL